ncbi:MAG: hypothetical protein PGN07_08350 [Aeromicrobium erythreum]
MTTTAQVRKAALAQAGAGEVEVGGTRGWAVEGRVFAAIDDEGGAVLVLGPEARGRMAAELPGVTTTASGVRVELDRVNAMAVNHWVGEAWRTVAPAHLVAEGERAARSAAEGDDDLPAVGAPARRALHAAGLGSLDAVAAVPSDEVEGLHGVGPAAARRLREALAARGVTW